MLSRTEVKNLVIRWQEDGHKVVFTNGCFDILHRGHVEYLEAAKEAGDKLIIGLNSDNSVRKLKGSTRPFQNEQDRRAILTALSCVDAVVVFDEDTPAKLIAELLPDVLIKGGDYDKDEIVGRDTILANGGEIIIIPFVEGVSTSNIISRILSRKALD
ncbi:MAG: D-glycero-beta-D-manno-heptose 1-phosphate adenylyltransferase [Candidatus Marinimicrobia bacterium]|jgi:rfaE bifunctional protein nucleotidyltransferase chain/domain|nr:D-glycero-beta-D-manno-heptose 1-phosphate adenylyltransferase [Candidatus Neomarinimicrobiota bacterium]MDP6500780.1 D-glycero-beta-D-manno-heptose 1-phosphate adenylyltransferase [Candidatus Neomarinimicrobiota bacterium]MDP6725820.1 D-glycero-beta-D-manno-heptose 1-phosphate adenylyltransferase [Candidatus Neomarinimicrobiota bacterium]|tara:strand:- start:39627 stop:40100 length:474 start_codon:yes stop_codon:yes gene_type:complete